MKFVHRTHYCNQCNKKAFFLQFTTKKTVEQDYNCPRCSNKVISFWEELNKRFVFSYFIGVPFFAMSAIYGFWTSTLNQIRSVDIFVIIFNVFLSGVFTVYGFRYSKLKDIPQVSDKSTDNLKVFRKQIAFSFIFTLCGLLIAVVVDILSVLIWLGIARIS